MNYKPNPIKTDHIKLPEDIRYLQEELARNIHERWASQRIAEGWTYGAKRDDDRKTHPCLVPYEQLPENEKEYDRITATETLKMIMSIGYEIKK